eukprot:CAMPEP_0202446226 /NCGR_PEP_ID=MMETSP1360-20130828/4798_1 /ASSEMBLY_ACC=CAM_ASM_000848 /TAXON_ID=515479 /ORGANISM="Licmophora paradoxa, Strain CCMP2313" /LENGTH=63 /DNA_ID=CAMNT_0049062669 /DNA_START=303 /DNA_END=497 /DNA_ORIENTATION=+
MAYLELSHMAADYDESELETGDDDDDNIMNMMICYMGQRYSSLTDVAEHNRLKTALIKHFSIE